MERLNLEQKISLLNAAIQISALRTGGAIDLQELENVYFRLRKLLEE